MANEIVERIIIVVLGLRHRTVKAPKMQIKAATKEDNDDYFIPRLGLALNSESSVYQYSLHSRN